MTFFAWFINQDDDSGMLVFHFFILFDLNKAISDVCFKF